MLILIATCFLSGWMTFTPQPGWDITEVKGISHGNNLMFTPATNPLTSGYPPHEEQATTKITLKRSMQPGERIELPKGCEVVTEPEVK